MTQNPHELAGVSSDHRSPEQERNPEDAREVFPVQFEKDYLDFRGKPVVEEEGPLVPKSSSAPASVNSQPSVTGLEDVSNDDLENLVPESAEKDKSQATTAPVSPPPISHPKI